MSCTAIVTYRIPSDLYISDEYVFSPTLFNFFNSFVPFVLLSVIILQIRHNLQLALRGELEDFTESGHVSTRFPLVFPIYSKVLTALALTFLALSINNLFSLTRETLSGFVIFVTSSLCRAIQLQLEVAVRTLVLISLYRFLSHFTVLFRSAVTISSVPHHRASPDRCALRVGFGLPSAAERRP